MIETLLTKDTPQGSFKLLFDPRINLVTATLNGQDLPPKHTDGTLSHFGPIPISKKMKAAIAYRRVIWQSSAWKTLWDLRLEAEHAPCLSAQQKAFESITALAAKHPEISQGMPPT